MAVQPESKFKAMLRRAWKRSFPDGWSAYFDPSGIGHPGTPDLLLVGQGLTLWVEAKYGKNRCSALQTRQQTRLAKAGALVLVATADGLGDAATVHWQYRAPDGALHLRQPSCSWGVLRAEGFAAAPALRAWLPPALHHTDLNPPGATCTFP